MTYHLGNYYKPNLPPIVDSGSGELIPVRLTDHEMAIIARLIDGQTESEIAHSTGRKRNTIKVHLQNIRKKTDSPNTMTAVIAILNALLVETKNITIQQLITIDYGG